jgi:hypothetical protein
MNHLMTYVVDISEVVFEKGTSPGRFSYFVQYLHQKQTQEAI